MNLVLRLVLPLMFCGLAWANWRNFKSEEKKRLRMDDRLLVTAYETAPGSDGKTTRAFVTLRNTSPLDLHRLTLVMDCQTRGVGKTEWQREFVAEVPSGATVRLPEWELGVTLQVGTSFECRVVSAQE